MLLLLPAVGSADLTVLLGFLLLLISFGIGTTLIDKLNAGSQLNGTLVGGLLFVMLIAVVSWRYTIPGYRIIISAILWGGILLYVVGTLLWLGLWVFIQFRHTESEPVYGHDDIQVRIMTIGAESVVQETVNALPDSITNRHVIAEQSLSIEGATVHVVPDEFACEATRKGRALEWARRHLECEREYILYLDEDTIVKSFEGLPDADIVQFGERPYRTGGILPYFAEIFRIGFQVEQRAFGFLPVPLYAWGGGIAIRESIEQQVGWNYDTIIEDTVFAWKATIKHDADFETLDTWFYNQSPSTIRSMIAQRRRWIGGGERELHRVPRRYRVVFKFRNFVWGMTPLASVLPFVTLAFPGLIIGEDSYLTFSFLLLLTPLLWVLVGFDYFREHQLIGVMSVLLTPVITIVHSAGAFIGLIAKPQSFVTTAKAGDSEFETEEQSLFLDGGMSLAEQVVYVFNQTIGGLRRGLENVVDPVLTPVSRVLGVERTLGVGLPFERKHCRVRPAVILGVIVLVGLGIRLYDLGGASYWFDEIYSVAYRGTLPIDQLVFDQEPHPPLYYLILKYWMAAFGQGEFAVRLLSTLFSVGTMVGVYYLCKELFDRQAGYLGAALTAVSVFNLHASQTARMYALLSFFTVASIYFMIRLLRVGGYRNGVTFVLTALGALLTHPLGAFVALGHNIYVVSVLLADPDKRWSRLKRWVAVELPVSVVYFAFVLTVMLPQLRAKATGQGKAGWLKPPTTGDIYAGLVSLFGAPVQYPFADFSPAAMATAIFIIVVTAVALVVGSIRYTGGTSTPNPQETGQTTARIPLRLDRRGGRGKVLAIVFFGTCFVLPAVASYVVTPMFVPRYLASASVIAILLMAGAVGTIRRDALKIAFVILLLVPSISLVGVYQGTSTAEGWEQPVDHINSQPAATSGDSPLVVVQPGWAIPAVEFYGITDNADLAGFYQGDYEPGRSRAATTEAAQQQLIDSHEHIYVITYSEVGIKDIDNTLSGTHKRVSRVRYGILTVDTYVREDGDTDTADENAEKTISEPVQKR